MSGQLDYQACNGGGGGGGVFFDLGRPVVGGWTSHGPLAQSFDPVRSTELMWGGEFGQEGAVLWAADVATGELVESHQLGW